MSPARIFTAFITATILLASQSLAGGYPDRPVRVIVPFGAGGGADLIARSLSAKLSEMWKQSVIVENRVGAGGSIGADLVAKSVADGYTLLVHSSAYASSAAFYAKLPYDPLKDLVSVAPLGSAGNVLVTGKVSGLKSVAELIAAAKKKHRKMKFGSAGAGSGTHLNAVKFNLAAGLRSVHVSDDLGAMAVNEDVMAGRIDYWFAPIASVLPLLDNDSLVILGVSSKERTKSLPNVPTLSELGLKGFDYKLWYGVWAPAGISDEVHKKLAEDAVIALASPEVSDQLERNGVSPMDMTPAKFARFIEGEIRESTRIIKAAGIKQQ